MYRNTNDPQKYSEIFIFVANFLVLFVAFVNSCFLFIFCHILCLYFIYLLSMYFYIQRLFNKLGKKERQRGEVKNRQQYNGHDHGFKVGQSIFPDKGPCTQFIDHLSEIMGLRMIFKKIIKFFQRKSPSTPTTQPYFYWEKRKGRGTRPWIRVSPGEGWNGLAGGANVQVKGLYQRFIRVTG